MSRHFRNFIEWLYLKSPNNLVYTDEMSGAKTRTYYDDIVKEKYDKKEVFVAFIDIDNLKKINDERGHHEGSKVIRTVVEQLERLNLLEICRTGGDEFVVVAEKEFNPQNLNIVDNVSYGYVVKRDTESMVDAVKVADSYMYKRKNRIHNKELQKKTKSSNKRRKKNNT